MHARAAAAAARSVVGEDAGAGGAIEHATEAHIKSGLEGVTANKRLVFLHSWLKSVPASDPTNPARIPSDPKELLNFYEGRGKEGTH